MAEYLSLPLSQLKERRACFADKSVLCLSDFIQGLNVLALGDGGEP